VRGRAVAVDSGSFRSRAEAQRGVLGRNGLAPGVCQDEMGSARGNLQAAFGRGCLHAGRKATAGLGNEGAA
jgi:hypothetical protein